MNWFTNSALFFRKNWGFLSFLILFVAAIAYFTYLQATPTFADPDSFYHVKMALLISEHGIVNHFPWLQFTILKNSYTDQHFLYHVLLIPFTKLMDPLRAAKLATVFLCTGLVLFFYWFLRKQRIALAFIFTVVLLITTPFIFRINLVKAPAFAIFMLLIGLYCLFSHRYLGLYFLSLLYVWAYGGFVLILVFSGIYAFVSLLYDWWRSKSPQRFMIILSHSRAVRLFIASGLGVLTGLLANPSFPHNLVFYWHQLVKIGIINYQKVIPVGNEWYPYKFMDLTAGSAVLTILIFVSFFLYIINRRWPSKKVITLFIIYFFFLVFTLKSSRYVEYYVPFAVLFVAFAINEHLGQFHWPRWWSQLYEFYNRHRIVSTVVVVYFLVSVPTIAIKDARHTYTDLKNGIPLTRFAKSSAWLVENSNAEDIVFHSSWDEFPILFYYNDKDYYIIGLDPTFMYEYNAGLYREMVAITTGQQRDNLHDDIKNDFRSSFVFVEKGHTVMNTNIQSSEGFQQVYSDNEATIYRVL